MENVRTFLREGRHCRARRFFAAGDPKWNLGLLRTDDEENCELKDFYGPFCCQGFKAEPGGSKTCVARAYEICDMAYTHGHWAPKGQTIEAALFWARKRTCSTRTSCIKKRCATLEGRRKEGRKKWCTVKKRTRKWTGGDHKTQNKRRRSRRWCCRMETRSRWKAWPESRRTLCLKNRDSNKKRMPPTVGMVEEAAVRRSRPIEREVQARKAHAEHLVRCISCQGKRMPEESSWEGRLEERIAKTPWNRGRKSAGDCGDAEGTNSKSLRSRWTGCFTSKSPIVRRQSQLSEGQNCERDAEAITPGKKCAKWPFSSRNAPWGYGCSSSWKPVQQVILRNRMLNQRKGSRVSGPLR